jgi:hypothetical protein
LPLGSRVIMDPWTGRVEMNKARSAPVMAVREKLPFTLTPFYPYLTRVSAERETASVPAAASNNPAPTAQSTSQDQSSPENADQVLSHPASLDGAK